MIKATLRLALQTAMTLYFSHKLQQLDEAVTKVRVLESRVEQLERRLAGVINVSRAVH